MPSVAAAHCIHDDITTFYAQPGRFNFANSRETGWVNRSIVDAFMHDDYNEGAADYKSKGDIAIFVMNEAVEFTPLVQPACLPLAGTNTTNVEGTTVGHGNYNDTTKYENTPKHGQMRTISEYECLHRGGRYSNIVSRSSFCAQGEGVAPCSGDSGGGFFVLNEEKYEVYGVVSQALNSKKCRATDYSVYVDVPKYIQWINEVGELF
jgi:hypothetical protein